MSRPPLPPLPAPSPPPPREGADVRLTQTANAYQPRVQPREMDDACWAWDGGYGRTVPARVDFASTRAALPANELHKQHVVPRNSLFVDTALVDLTQREAA